MTPISIKLSVKNDIKRVIKVITAKNFLLLEKALQIIIKSGNIPTIGKEAVIKRKIYIISKGVLKSFDVILSPINNELSFSKLLDTK